MITAKQNTIQEDCPVAIVGMGCLFPNAQDVTEFWRSIRRGEDGIREIPRTHWSIADYYDPDPKAPDKTYCARGGFLSPVAFDPTEFGIPPNLLEATDTTQLLSLVVAKAALEDAGYGEGRDFNRERVSVVLGVTGTQELVLPLAARLGQPVWRRALREAGIAPEVAEQVVRRIADSYVPWQESSFPGLLGNVVAGRIANRLNLRGTNCVVDAACASSLAAVHLSALELASGRCDMALTGGADTLNDVFMYLCFSKTPALSPTGDARPFADAADGTVLGEGIGMIVLKRLEDARRDGDRIYAVIRGIGTSSDGRSQSIYAPHPAGQARALRNAYPLAGFGPESVGLIEAHGTGTKVGDAAEFEALRTVFREGQSDGTWCALGSIKSQIGHTKAAAGVAGLIKATLAIYNRSLPPTIKIERPSSKLGIQESPFYLNTELRPWLPRDGQPRRAGVSAFGFGGSNFHVLLEEHEATLPEVAWDGSVEIIALSADSTAGLLEQIDDWLATAGTEGFGHREFAFRAAGSRRSFHTGGEHRLVLVVAQGEAPADLLRRTRERLVAEGGASARSWNSPSVFYGTGLPEGQLAFLFPGQGSQYVGMGRELACTFPEMLNVLVEAEAAGTRTSGSELRLSDAIYPTPVFSEPEREQQSAALRRTEIAQPAIGAVSLGMCRVLERFGVRPALVAGHSYGELTALCVAGRFDADTLHTLSRLRGRLMAEGSGDRGTMLAVKAPLPELEDLIAAEAPDVVIANRNAPNQGILSGPREAIGRALQACQARGFVTKPLAVSGAFHSRLMESAVGPFRQALESVTFQNGTIPVYANATGNVYPADAADSRALLGRQLISPVEFVREVESLHAAGARMFVELGPRSVLTSLVKSILGMRPHSAVALDVSAGRAPAMLDLARLLARLAAEGRPVGLSAWERQVAEPRKPRMVVSLVGANYRAPKSLAMSGPVTAGSGPSITPRELSRDSEDPRPEFVPTEAGGRAVLTQLGLETAPQDHRGGPSHEDVSRETPFEISQPSPEECASGAGEVIVEELFATAAEPSPAGFVTAAAACADELPQVSSDPTPIDPSHEEQSGETPLLPSVEPAVPRSPLLTADSAPSPELSETIQFVQDGLRAMQRLQQQTAEAHKRFLEVQAQAHTTLMILLTGQTPVKLRPTGEAADAPWPTPAAVGRSLLEPGFWPVPSEPAPPVLLGAEVGERSVPTPRREAVTVAGRSDALPLAPPVQGVPRGSTAAAAPDHSATVPTAGTQPERVRATIVPAAPSEPRREPATKTAETVVLDVVCEKTGYPREMIDLDMDIEADLGIDSIKRVEIVAAIEERVPQWTGIRPDQMGGLRTLREIVAVVGSDIGAVVGSDVGVGAADDSRLAAIPTYVGRARSSASEEPNVTWDAAGQSREVEVRRDEGARRSRAPVSVAGADVVPPAFAETLLQVVTQLTGYPREMLNLDMDMEADLGIDSIKRVEILAALEARLPQMPPVKPDHMGDLRTLRQIVEYCTAEPSGSQFKAAFAEDRVRAAFCEGGETPAGEPAPAALGTTRSSSAKQPGVAEATKTRSECRPEPPVGAIADGAPARADLIREDARSNESSRLENKIEAGIAIERLGLRPAALPSLDDSPTGKLPIAGGGEVLVTDDGAGLSKAIVSELISRGNLARLINSSESHAPTLDDAPSGPGVIQTERRAGPGGLIIVAPPTCSAGLGMDERSEAFLKTAFALAKSVAPQLREAAARGGALLATVSRMDGAFGLAGGSFDPVQGGLAGLVKTAAHEWPNVRCQAIDAARSWEDTGAAAAAIVRELASGGPNEVGLNRGRRCGLELSEASSTTGQAALSPGDVVVVTGGARGVTAACAEALARSCRPTLVVFGRTAVARHEPDWLAGLEDEAEIKRAIVQYGGEGTPRPKPGALGGAGAPAKPGSITPAELQAAYRRLIAEREVRRNLNRLAAAGARVVYYRVDLRVPGTTRAALASVRKKHGPIRALVHAAGVIADRRIEDKTPEQFAAVFDTKVAGLRNLLAALPLDELRHIVLFSSVSGRFGNAGQVDYAMANEVLNKAARRLAADLPNCRVVSINWGAWDGGMVTPALRREFERRGVALLPLESGAQAFVRELASIDRSAVEVVISAKRRSADDVEARRPKSAEGGPKRRNAETAEHRTAGVSKHEDIETVETLDIGTFSRDPQGSASLAPVESISANAPFATAFGRTLDVERHPFLRSHMIDGHPVLPVALMVEWLGHAAVHVHPGLQLHGLDHLRVLRGVVLRDGPPGLRFLTASAQRRGSVLEVPVELRGESAGAILGAMDADDEVLHARATAVLAGAWPPPPVLAVADSICDRRYARGVRGAYSEILFHGEHFQGIEEVVGFSAAGMVARLRAAPSPAKWMVDPLRSDWLADPLVLDAAFQMGVLWCYEELGVVGLPTYLRSYRQYRAAFPRSGVRAYLEVRERTAHKVVSDVTLADHAGVVVARIEGFECTADASLMAAFHRVSRVRATA